MRSNGATHVRLTAPANPPAHSVMRAEVEAEIAIVPSSSRTYLDAFSCCWFIVVRR